jgi:hypothetical protein
VCGGAMIEALFEDGENEHGCKQEGEKTRRESGAWLWEP